MDEKQRILGCATIIVVLALGCGIWGALSAIFWLMYTVVV